MQLLLSIGKKSMLEIFIPHLELNIYKCYESLTRFVPPRDGQATSEEGA